MATQFAQFAQFAPTHTEELRELRGPRRVRCPPAGRRPLTRASTPSPQDYTGLAWLFLGVANSDALLYDDEWQEVLKSHPDNFRLDYALSREQTNVDGGKMYIQDKVEEYSDEIFDRLDKGAHIYFCGLKGMMPGINDMLEAVCKTKNLNFEEKQAEWKKKGQWHVEVY